MWNSLNRKGIAAGLAAAGAAVLLMPVLLGFELPSIGAISSNVVGAIMILSAAGIAYGSLALWSALVLGGGAWTLVAPVAFGFYDGGEAFWTHMAAGFAWVLAGLAGHELLTRHSEERRSR